MKRPGKRVRSRRADSSGTSGSRLVGWMSCGVVLVLAAAAIVVGSGAAHIGSRSSDAGSWLASLRMSTLAHVNGTTGQVDGRVPLGRTTKGPLDVTQDGNTILVLDSSTGVVSRIDPSQLTVSATQPFTGGQGLRLVAAGDNAWVVDTAAGSVQRIDPATLAPVAAPVDLGARPLGEADADAAGVLWVVIPSTGDAVPVQDDKAGDPIRVGAPGDPLALTVAGGRAAVVDPKAGTLQVVSADGQGMAVRLPDALTTSDPTKLLVPSDGDSPLVPVLAPDSGTLAVVNTDSGVVQAVTLDMSDAQTYGRPEAEGQSVYIPDWGTGTVLVYDTATAAFRQPVTVTGVPGRLDVYTRGGRVWVNDESNATAAVIDDDGSVHLIDKSGDTAPGSAGGSDSAAPTATDGMSPAPGATDQPTDQPTDTSGATPPAPGGGDGGGTGGGGASGGGGSGGGDNGGGPLQPTATSTVTVTAPGPSDTGTQPGVPTDTGTASVPGTGTPTATVTGTGTPTASPTSPPTTPAPVDGPPGRPKATTGDGIISITFPPASGARPDSYELDGAPAGATVVPTREPAGGPFQFEIRSLACTPNAQYAFTVVAVYGTKRVASQPSPAVRPCVTPGVPTSLTQKKSNHQMVLSWKAPAGTGLTYDVTWQGSGGAPSGRRTVSGTSVTVTGLANSRTYAVTVTAVNGGGRSAAARATVDMTPPKMTIAVHDNRPNDVAIGVRTDPTSLSGSRVAAIPPGWNGPVTVYCQTRGSTERRDNGSGSASDVWDRITYKGSTGWTTDLYIATTNSDRGTYSPELWECT